jgi:hypothetical protein
MIQDLDRGWTARVRCTVGGFHEVAGLDESREHQLALNSGASGPRQPNDWPQQRGASTCPTTSRCLPASHRLHVSA